MAEFTEWKRTYELTLIQQRDEYVNIIKSDYEKTIEELKYEVNDLSREITVMKIE